MYSEKSSAITVDTLLAGRVKLLQPKKGYRVAIDPVFLAASIPVESGETILDVGAGVGAASLCLAQRKKDCKITGLERQSDLVLLSMENAKVNSCSTRVRFICGDLTDPDEDLEGSEYDHVMTNPPFLEKGSATLSPYVGKALSNVESTATLENWVRFCLSMVRIGGTVTFIYTMDRLDELLGHLGDGLGDKIVFPLQPDSEKNAKRVLVHGKKGGSGRTCFAQGLILHEADGRYTPEADSVLREGMPLLL
ncbi:MAG: methyltransferase [Alphaproteobacteria bacterium]|jgi:tRNA1(Val) A37 N6-methylase TrmN6|nr:methyltransferase [Alphaproteobacteria bacterium]MBT5390159.1 methyltransferase [Alphaproteobacteria bacterium]MBT5540003.1 methyltransferase [Alphaproteobacteria bacterium]MBT5654184.1 methyltransferase [Alphaproteobacteria bacterium]